MGDCGWARRLWCGLRMRRGCLGETVEGSREGFAESDLVALRLGKADLLIMDSSDELSCYGLLVGRRSCCLPSSRHLGLRLHRRPQSLVLPSMVYHRCHVCASCSSCAPSLTSTDCLIWCSTDFAVLTHWRRFSSGMPLTQSSVS